MLPTSTSPSAFEDNLLHRLAVVQTLDNNLTSAIMTSTIMTSIERIPWGSVPLELYVLAQWTSLPIDDLSKRRRQLAQQFTAIGYFGRFVGAR